MIKYEIHTAKVGSDQQLYADNKLYDSYESTKKYFESKKDANQHVSDKKYDKEYLMGILNDLDLDLLTTRFWVHVVSVDTDGDGLNYVIDEYEISILEKHDRMLLELRKVLNSPESDEIMRNLAEKSNQKVKRLKPLIHKYGYRGLLETATTRNLQNIFWLLISTGLLREHSTHHMNMLSASENWIELDDFETERFDVEGLRVSIYSGQGESFANVHLDDGIVQLD